MWLTILGVFASVLSANPLVPQAVKQGLADGLAAIGAIFSSGAVENPSADTILTAMLGTLQALKADPNLPADILGQVSNLIVIIQDTLAADKEAQQGVDESKIQPIDPQP